MSKDASKAMGLIVMATLAALIGASGCSSSQQQSSPQSPGGAIASSSDGSMSNPAEPPSMGDDSGGGEPIVDADGDSSSVTPDSSLDACSPPDTTQIVAGRADFIVDGCAPSRFVGRGRVLSALTDPNGTVGDIELVVTPDQNRCGEQEALPWLNYTLEGGGGLSQGQQVHVDYYAASDLPGIGGVVIAALSDMQSRELIAGSYHQALEFLDQVPLSELFGLRRVVAEGACVESSDSRCFEQEERLALLITQQDGSSVRLTTFEEASVAGERGPLRVIYHDGYRRAGAASGNCSDLVRGAFVHFSVLPQR